MRFGGICALHYKDSKTVSLCSRSAQGLFQVQADVRAADNPTVTTTDCGARVWLTRHWLCSFFVSAAFCDSFSLFHCALCHDSYMPRSVRPNTDRFMTGWFLAMLWVSLSTCLLRSGVGSASAGASLLLSSVLLVPEWTVLQTRSLKNIFQKYHCKR